MRCWNFEAGSDILPASCGKAITMPVLQILGLVIGIGLFALVLLVNNPGAAADAVAVAGWGVLAVIAYQAVPLSLDNAGWWRLLPRLGRPSLLAALQARWIGQSVNSLLPVGQVGGDVVRAGLMARRGVPVGAAGASVVVDMTLGLMTQLVFLLCGAAALAAMGKGSGLGSAVSVAVVGGIAAVVAVLAALKFGLFNGVALLIGKVNGGGAWAAAVHDAIPEVFGRSDAIVAASAWRLAGWTAQVGETWLALHFLGADVGLAGALVIESLVAAVRSAAFFIPGALGAQEGGLMVLAAAVGVPAEAALALALVKRLREIAVGAPGLATWLINERKGLARLVMRAGWRGGGS